MSLKRKINQSLSKRAQMLLEGDEYHHVDFKRSPKAVESDDLVAFANSEHGGSLLLGVDEIKDEKGRQMGKIVGCEVSDAMKLMITSRAFSCYPPVEIEIIVENNAELPFYRIEVPSGNNKPYCTSGGTYKIREDGRNKTLRPDELLGLFMHSEAKDFFARFKESGNPALQNEMEVLKKDITVLHQKLNAIMRQLKVEEI